MISRDTLGLHIEALLRKPQQLWKRVLASPTRQLLDALYHNDSIFDPRASNIDEFLEIDDVIISCVPQLPYINLSGKFAEWFRGLIDKLFNLSERALQVVIQGLGRYAILSHRWDLDDQELTFECMEHFGSEGSRGQERRGYAKFRGFCDAAAFHGCRYVWIDRGCINRRDKAELDVSISSMYQWYSKAYVTIVYLSETTEADHEIFYYPFQDSWWRRGWTLQEFVASTRKRYYYRNWKPIDDQDWDHDARLFDDQDGSHGGFLTRVFQSMQSRQTKLPEDMAYCLHSLLNVHPPIRYGEGFERAFYRLQTEYVTGGCPISGYSRSVASNQFSKARLFRWSGKRSAWNSMFASDFKSFNVKQAQLKYHSLRDRFNIMPTILITTPNNRDILSIEMYLYPIHYDAEGHAFRVSGGIKIDVLLDEGSERDVGSAGWVLGLMREDRRYVFGIILRKTSDDGRSLYERVGIMVSTTKEWGDRDVLSVLWRDCAQVQLVHIA
ncbi:hypothetical protein AB1N83_012360 [Pleurotus pulmonarius]